MKKQKNQPQSPNDQAMHLGLLPILLLLVCAFPLSGKTDITTLAKGKLFIPGVAIRPFETSIPTLPVSESPTKVYAIDAIQDYRIPNDPGYQYLSLQVEGADGGKKEVKEAWGTTRFIVNGGAGATIKAVFEIGEGDNQIPGGSTIRFIVGRKGATRTAQTTSGCDGGAGTAVFIKKPHDAQWYMLAVAGGGGGAYSDCCSVKGEGKEASIYENGSKGNGDGGPGGTDGNAGGRVGTSYTSTPGGGAFTNANAYTCGSAGWPGGDQDPTKEPTGGTVCDGPSGPWGFGGGGTSYADLKHGTSGAGGGGYSGGGSGREYNSGGGGGSYLNTHMAVYGFRKANGTTSDTQDGFVIFKFTNENPVRSIKFAANTAKCAAVQDANASGDTNVELASCQNGPTQNWALENNRIMLADNTSKCLEIYKNYTANGTNVQLYNCNDSPGQGWIYDVYRKIIRSGNDFNKCIDLVNGITTSGTNIQLYDCVSDEHQVNQQWVIDGVPSKMPGGSNKRIYLEMDRNKCVDIVNGSTANGANVQLNTCNSTNAQYLVFDNRYLRMQANTGKCLSLEDGGDANGNNIHLWDCKGQDNQKWVYDGFAKAFRSVVNINKCLSIEGDAGSEAPDGANIHLWDCKNNANQRFDLY